MREAQVPFDRRPVRLVVAGGLTVLATALALYEIGRESVILDESTSIAFARSSWPDFVRFMSSREINQGLYYLLLRGWVELGTSEGFVRVLSALPAIATVPVVYALASRLFGFVPAAAAGLLQATNAFAVWHAQEARGYSLAMLLAAASTYSLVRALDRSTPARWAVYAAVSAVGLYAHFFVGLVLLAQLLAVGAHPATRRRLRPLLVADGVVALAATPILLVVGSYRGEPFPWLGFPSPRDLVVAAGLLLGAPRGSGGTVVEIAVPVVAGMAGLIGTAGLTAARSLRRRGMPDFAVVLVACWLLVPPAVALAASLVTPTFVPRFLIVIVPAVAVAAAIPLSAPAFRRLGLVAVAAVAAASIAGVVVQANDASKEDWRSATKAVLDDAGDGDGIVFVRASVAKPFAYYATRSGRPIVLAPVYPRVDWVRPFPVLRAQPPLGPTLADAAGRFPRIWLVVSHADADDLARAVRALEDGYDVAKLEKFREVEVTLYVPVEPP